MKSTSKELEIATQNLLNLPPVEPWPEPVDGSLLLDALAQTVRRLVVLPKWGPETMALWNLHTYAFELRDVTTYIGIESPEHRCGKSTLITVLSELAHRAIVSSNVSSPALFRVIAQLRPALLIDEADTFMHGNEELRGILNSGYYRKTSFVLRAVNQSVQNVGDNGETELQSSGLASFSCWCPKLIARIGRLPMTLADRCIVFRMHRKTRDEQCDRLKTLKPEVLKRQCARFALDHADAIAAAQPHIPSELNDRAADIWEPLLVLADLAGGPWPELARQAAVAVTAATQDSNPVASLLLDIFVLFTHHKADRMFTRELLEGLSSFAGRPWAEMRKGKELTDIWLAQQVRPYGIKPRTLWIGDKSAKGYLQEDFVEVCRRYVSKSDLAVLFAETGPSEPPASHSGGPGPSTPQSLSE